MKCTIYGGQTPRGNVQLSGAKNSATRLLAATLLADTPSTLLRFPTTLVDADHKMRFMRGLGVDVQVSDEEQTVTVSPATLKTSDFGADDDFPIRTTYLLAASQIRRNGFARIPYPGGCKIGSRGYDLHVMVWRALGCEVVETPVAIEVRGDGFTAGVIDFPISTVGGTENALLCASIARGVTEISNAYITPEIDDLIEFLRRMGAQIEVSGGSFIRVEGVDRLSGVRMPVMTDRIEALTWIVYAILSGGDIRVDGVPFASMEIPLIHLEKAGIDLFRNSSSVYVQPDCLRNGEVQPFELACGAHPGIISDMQPFFVLLALAAKGRSRVFDYRYPERVGYVTELARLCGEGSLSAEHGKITIDGGRGFRAARAHSTDLRGSMALVVAALCAPEGVSTIEDVHLALRGYDDLAGKLAKLGVQIKVGE